MLTSQDLDLELDPTRVSSPEELQKNAMQLQIVAKVFIDDICTSAPSIPASFRKICSIVRIASNPNSCCADCLTDLGCGAPAFPGRQVHGCRCLCLPPLLLSCYRGSRCRRARWNPAVQGDAPRAVAHCQSDTEPCQQRALWCKRAVHVSSEPLSHAKHLQSHCFSARDLCKNPQALQIGMPANQS